MKRIYDKVKLGFALVPFIVLAVFYTFVLWVWIKVGHLPHYNFPDPKTIEISSIYSIVKRIIDLLVIVICFELVTSIFFLLKSKLIWDNKLLIFFTGLFLMILLISFDPSHLFEWFVD